MAEKRKCLLISDFNIHNFAGYLANDAESPAIEPVVAPFGQVVPTLLDTEAEYWQPPPDYVVIWTQPQRIIPSFQELLLYRRVSLDKMLDEVDTYASLLLGISSKVRCILIPTWVTPFYHRGWGMLDMKIGGSTQALMRLNLRLAEALEKAANIYLLPAERWTSYAGKNAYHPKLWYMGKIPFGNEVFKEAVKDIKAALRGINGQARKLLIVDLDNTLWGGIVGDIGWENLILGGHDPIGEAYADFQQALKSLTNRGVLLGIASKNEESLALEAIRKHPEMVLRVEDFAGWKINWKDKAQNIVDLTRELNLGLDSVVFIDDHPVERARVREALPEVFVPEWPEDNSLYTRTLLSLSCFDTPIVSEEDLERTKMYQSERQREALKSTIGSFAEWLQTLDMRVTAEELQEANSARTAQLFNKTNQMNLSTRRMTEAELRAWAGQNNRKLWVFRVADKFGDAGLTGILSVEVSEQRGRIVDFILSCRVMGRQVEQAMLYTAIQYCQALGLTEVYAQYVPTPKNKPCLEFWKTSGFRYDEHHNTFHWLLSEHYPKPTQIKLEGCIG